MNKMLDREYYLNPSNLASFSRMEELIEGFTGMLAIVYIEDKFPLKQAEEYVQTRPIIFLCKVINGVVDMKELYWYLTVIGTPTPKEWLIKNTAISLLSMDTEQLRLEWLYTVEKLSPVFNIKNNAGNLFQYTLKDLVDNPIKPAKYATDI
jgi:hypothetical protein